MIVTPDYVVKELEVTTWERCDAPLSDEVLAIDEKLKADPRNADLWMERGLALGRQNLFREETEALSKAIALAPFKGIYYRHRGHRFLSCYRFEDACADFTMATRLIPKNWDSWYHLGLSHYLLGDWEMAEKAYKRCLEVSGSVLDRIPCVDWYWLTLMQMGKKVEAAKLLETVDGGAGPEIEKDFVTNIYYQRVRLYKGLVSADGFVPQKNSVGGDFEMVQILTMAYGLSCWYGFNGQPDKAAETRGFILSEGGAMWYQAFAYLAAMADRRRIDGV
jgi:tetratricopeptide (TPR) repeat protein